MREERGEYRPAHGNGCPTGKIVGKKKGTLSRHDIHLSILINLHNGDILWKTKKLKRVEKSSSFGILSVKSSSIGLLKNGFLNNVQKKNNQYINNFVIN